ncbi:F-box protein SKIP23 [Rhynchospora pubera]|uniref:F-box protein SKIP23 n=1 Tax=Rhynchospora pubera TaxID=906938 RepID=A0AAV8BQF5_9POAL|nr:F-box protein SKIP23 [Rhynchospora pubera]
MKSNESQERDWSSLPPDVLNLIAKKIGEITGFVRFRAVCTSWCSSTPISDLPPQFPWIFTCHYSYKYPYVQKVEIYSLTLRKTYTFHPPNSLVRQFFGPSEEYLYMLNDSCCHRNAIGSRWFNLKAVLADISTSLLTGSRFGKTRPYSSEDISSHVTSYLSLFNPFNNRLFLLPAHDFGQDPYYIGTWQNQMREYVICYANECCQNPKLISWHPGQDNWCEVNLGSGYANCNHFYLKGMLFSVESGTRNRIIKVTDIGTGTLISVLPPIEGCSHYIDDYLVEVSGDILRDIRICDDEHPNPLMSELFEVYRLDGNKNGLPCWVKVTSIGDHALFIDFNDALTIKANDAAMIKRNSIYYIRRITILDRTFLYDAQRMDIHTGAVEYLIRCSRDQLPHWTEVPTRWRRKWCNAVYRSYKWGRTSKLDFPEEKQSIKLMS